jgi:hypothetical protein
MTLQRRDITNNWNEAIMNDAGSNDPETVNKFYFRNFLVYSFQLFPDTNVKPWIPLYNDICNVLLPQFSKRGL